MKKTALVGFTRIDAFCWLATEARDRGCSVQVSATQKTAWLRGEIVLMVRDEAELNALPGGVDQIITRQSLEGIA